MAWLTQISGKQIKDLAISNNHIAANAAIAESKLALDYSTQDLVDKAVRIDVSRTIEEAVVVTFPKSGYHIQDIVNNKTYLVQFQNGVQVLTEV